MAVLAAAVGLAGVLATTGGAGGDRRMLLVLGVGAVLVLVAATRLKRSRDRARVVDAHAAACEEHGLEAVDEPLGLPDDVWAGFALLPRGSRERSAALAMGDRVTVRLAGEPLELERCAFEWWWERAEDGDDDGHHRWTRRRALAVALRSPVRLPWVRLSAAPDRAPGWMRSVASSLGAVEPERPSTGDASFDERHLLALEDPAVVSLLFDDAFRAAVTERFDGVWFELRDDVALVVVATDQRPSEVGYDTTTVDEVGRAASGAVRDSQLGDRLGHRPADVAALVGARATAVALLEAMPAGFWDAAAGGD